MASKTRRRASFQEVKKTEALPARPVSKWHDLWWPRLLRAGPWLAWIPLIGIAIFFLGISWRKWPDPLIDFGRELYVPWRLAHGAVLYRDVDDFFGPLSQYFNAALFRLFVPGMMVLVTANLCIFAGIVIALYTLFRRGWGAGAAFVSTAIFIAVFGFGQYVDFGNYNYATPYSHESTHGFLLGLLLILALLRWIETPTLLWSSLAGLLFGLTLVLKTEFILAAALLTFAALLIRWKYEGAVPLPSTGAWVAGAILPTLGFAVYFSTKMPLADALASASNAWLNATAVSAQAGPIQIGFLGFDQPWQHLLEHAAATLALILLIAGIFGIAWLVERSTVLWQRMLLAGALVGGMGWLAFAGINWARAGRCLPGFVVIYVLICAASLLRDKSSGPWPRVPTIRLLLALLAAALIARMILNGRISQYGFYQAAIAALLVPAVMLGELPAWLNLGRWGKTVVILGTLTLVASGAVIVSSRSKDVLDAKDYPIGEGGDQFYAFPPNVEPTGEIVHLVADWLATLPANQTLTVLPEGEMLNYLGRIPSPVAPFVFYSAAGDVTREQKIVDDLTRHPPDWIVLLSRDLREYGIQRFGEAPGKGRQIMRWVAANYREEGNFGGNPLNAGEHGLIVLRHQGVAAQPQH